MRWKAVVCVGWLAPLGGCNMAYYAGHNLTNETVSRVDERRLSKRLRAEARAAWAEVCRRHPDRSFTPEFADGFAEGYADHLETGGPPQPPIVPPPRYRRQGYLSPEGHARAKDYLVGFKYGAEVACATGRRHFLTVPVLLAEEQPEVPLSVVRLPAPPDPEPTAPLPPPRPVDPAKVPDVPKIPDPAKTPTSRVEPSGPLAVPVSADLPPLRPPVDGPPPPRPPVPEPIVGR